MYDWVYGISQIATVVLSIIAGVIAILLFKIAAEKKVLHAWKWLIPALVFFAIIEILGILKTFGIYTSQFWTHILPGVVLGFLIVALVVQINIKRGWLI